jgi:ornithine--oxo-acid transaminase
MMQVNFAQPATTASYSEFVNPQWVRLLDLLQMNVHYESCLVAELFTSDGRRILDFLSGYGVHNAGHNHPRIVQAIREELERCGPAMIQTHVAEPAGELAATLCRLAGGELSKAFFCSSGSEAVEAAIKFARAHTGRNALLSASGAFHGLTCGALSLMDDAFWREGFGSMLPEVASVPFGNLAALQEALKTGKYAAFIVEPIQSEAGVIVPPPDYFRSAQVLCRSAGTLLVFDEVQTGLYRTGPFLAAHRFGVSPDMVLLAKALSGGLVPCGAVLMSNPIYDSVYGSLRRSIVHTSTFSENALAMRAAAATLEVLESEGLGRRAARLGEELQQRLRDVLAPFEMVKDVRGQGLLLGIEFGKPAQLRLRAAFQAFHHIHPAMFGQILVMHLFRDHGILTQICGNNFLVLKVAPPLVVTENELEEFVTAVHNVVRQAHSSPAFWSEALGMARRAINI